MLRIGKQLLWMLVAVLVLGCERARTPEFFMLHPEYIQPVYDQCVMSDSPSDKRSMECVAVMTVIPLFKQYLSEVTANRAQYGLKIMQAEIRLVELQKSLRAIENQMHELSPRDEQFQTLQAQKDQIEHEIYRQELHIKSRLAVLRAIFKV